MTPIMKPTNSPPVMGLAEAAEACGVSVSTIRRKRADLVKLGAAQTAKGWHIPVTALIELGLMPSVTEPPMTPVEPQVILDLKPVMMPPVDAQYDALTGEVETLRVQLADAERRAAVAEAIAAERDRIISAQAMALRMLEAGTSQPEKTDDSPQNLGNEPVTEKAMSKSGQTNINMTRSRPGWRRFLGRH